SKNPTWTYHQVISQILATADKSSALAGKVASGGIVNAAAAVGTPAGGLPQIVSAVPMGPSPTSVSSVRVTFDRAINFATFTAADCSLTGPGGQALPVSNVKEVSGSAGKGFDVVFAIQSAPGTYVLKIGPDVQDVNGVSMATFTGTFTVP